MNTLILRKPVFAVFMAISIVSSSASAFSPITMPSFGSTKATVATLFSTMAMRAHYVLQPVKTFVKEHPVLTAGAVVVTIATCIGAKKVMGLLRKQEVNNTLQTTSTDSQVVSKVGSVTETNASTIKKRVTFNDSVGTDSKRPINSQGLSEAANKKYDEIKKQLEAITSFALNSCMQNDNLLRVEIRLNENRFLREILQEIRNLHDINNFHEEVYYEAFQNQLKEILKKTDKPTDQFSAFGL